MTFSPKLVGISVVCLSLVLITLNCGSGSEGETESSAAAQSSSALADATLDMDSRLLVLRSGCEKNYHYDRDTGDIVGILIEKLQHGGTDQLHRCKEELAELGVVALAEVERLLNRNFDSEMGFSVVQNCIEILSLMGIPEAHDALVKCLDHPRDAVRAATLRALSKGAASADDFDRLLAHIPVERENPRQLAAVALYTADPVRAANEYLDWFETGRFQDLWPYVVGKVVVERDSGVVARCGELFSGVPLGVGLWLAASASAAGNEPAWELVNGLLMSPAVGQRTPAVSALIGAGMIEKLRPMINGDPDATIRSLCSQAAVGFEPKPEWLREEMLTLLGDNSVQVRNLALGYLISVNEPVALDLCISMLKGTRSELQDAVLVLVPRLQNQPEYAKRCFAELTAMDAKQSHLELSERVSILQAIGQIPLAEAAEYLRNAGLSGAGKAQGLKPHRFVMLQAANTGESGREWLIEELKSETDPERRLDMIWGIASDRDEVSRSFLIDHIQADIGPNELLFSADRLARIGPTSLVAPVLKRVVLDVRDQTVRSALQCLLWKWY